MAYNLFDNHILSMIYPQYFRLVLKIYMCSLFAMGGCSSINHNMKVLVKRSDSRAGRCQPYNRNVTSNDGSSYVDTVLYSCNVTSNYVPTYADQVLFGIEEETKKIVRDSITKPPKYFQDFKKKLKDCKSKLDEYRNYIQMYKSLNSLQQAGFFKGTIPPLESFVESLQQNLSSLYEEIQKVQDKIKEESPEFNCLSQRVSEQEELTWKEIKERFALEIKLIELQAKDIEKEEQKYSRKFEEYNGLQLQLTTDLQYLNNSLYYLYYNDCNYCDDCNYSNYSNYCRLQKLIESKNQCKEDIEKKMKILKREYSNLFKAPLSLVRETQTDIAAFREIVLQAKKPGVTHLNELISKMVICEGNIQQKIDMIEKKIKKINGTKLNELNELKNLESILFNVNLSNLPNFCPLSDSFEGLQYFSLPTKESDLYQFFKKLLNYRSLRVTETLILKCGYSQELISRNFLPHLSENILKDRENNKMNDLRTDWTIFQRLLYQSKIDITTKFCVESSDRITMLDFFLENNDTDSACKLIAYSTISLNPYCNLITLLSFSTSSSSLVNLFEKLMKPNSYLDEDDQYYVKCVEKFLSYIEDEIKKNQCYCTYPVKKFNNRSISPYYISLPDTPPPSPPPSPPDPPKPNAISCVFCAYRQAAALHEKNNHSANINSDSYLSNFPKSRDKCMISEDDS